MNENLHTAYGTSASDEEAVTALMEWIHASDLCAAASDDDYPACWRICNEAHNKLHKYFTNEAVTSIIINKDDIRHIITSNI
jgi:hypothetical protein